MENHHAERPSNARLANGCDSYGSSGLQLATPAYSHLPEVVADPSLYLVSSEHHNEKVFKSHRESDTEKIAYRLDEMHAKYGRWRTLPRRRVYLAISILILVVAAVVGIIVGVMVQRQHSKNNSAGENGTGSNDEKNLVWPETSLAVTGWRHEEADAYSIRLFYQDVEGFIRMSNMESTAVDSWTPGVQVLKAKRGTPLAAATNNQSAYAPQKSAMETRIYYLDEDSVLREHVFRDGDQTGFSGSLSAQNIKPAPDTRLASYWPSVAYQNADKTFSEARFNCSGTSANCWGSENLKVAGPGSSAALAMVPMGTHHFGMFLYYQREDGDLINIACSNDSTTWGPKEFQQRFPRSHAVSVFAMPSKADGSMLDFHLLYQDGDDGDLSWVWKRSGKWNGAVKDDALKGARRGTSMACLTPESWWDKRLAYNFDMSRCYFLGEGGRLKGVHWMDGKWKDLGIVRGVGKE